MKMKLKKAKHIKYVNPIGETPFRSFYESHLENGQLSWDKIQINARCPFPQNHKHEDQKPSFSVNTTTGLWMCHGCRKDGNVFKFAEELGIDINEIPGHAIYPYVDENDKSLYEIVRLFPKKFRIRRLDEKSNYIWNRGDIQLVPYRLPNLLQGIKAKRFVFIVEGEKDVENLAALGLTATCNVFGAGKWTDTYSKHLQDARAIIIADNDEPGKQHAYQVARSLVGIAKSIRILELPGLPEKGDVTNWLDSGGTRSKLLKLAKNCAKWSPTGKSDDAAASTTKSGGDKYAPLPIADLIAKYEGSMDPVWLWDGIIAEGALVLFAGIPKAGKSTFMRQMVKAIIDSNEFCGRETKKVNVLWLCLEEHPRDCARRFKSLGIDRNVYIKQPPFKLSGPNIDSIKGWVKQFNIGLIVVDTLGKLWNIKDENPSTETERALESILDITHATNAAVVILHHLRKTPGLDGSDFRGSSAIFASVDVGLSFKKGPDTYRQIESFSRYDETPAKMSLNFKDGKYESALDGEISFKQESQILLALDDTDQTVQSIANKSKVPESTVRRILRRIMKSDPGKVIRIGQGKKGHPEMYRLNKDDATNNKPKGGGDKGKKLRLRLSPKYQAQLLADKVRRIADWESVQSCN